MAVLNNLYPPLINTYAPAFLIDSGTEKDICKIYFSISAYNSFNEIRNAQITLSYQNTNLSALDESKYPCDIMITKIYEDVTASSENKYYIKINKSDIQDGKFEINQYYKLQIRFTGENASEISTATPQAIDSWLITNQAYFSEWSTVCLIRGISTPKLSIRGFEPAAEKTLWSTTNVDIVGKLTFADAAETDILKNYQIKLYNNLGTLLLDSGIQYSNNFSGINEINYSLKYILQDGNEYKIEIYYTTQQLYQDILTFDFMVIETSSERLNAEISSILDEENGRIGINIKGEQTEHFTGNITIRRTSSESNFTLWEDIHTESIEDKILDYTFYDYTIKSGVWYKYGVQKRDSMGNRGIINLLKEPLMIEFEDIFLLAEGRQLKIKFDPQIQSFQKTISESKVDTLGSKYPFIKRNGNMEYKQFPISGTITHFMDKDKLFTSREEIYQDTLELYNEYNSNNKINPFTDTTYERDFRDKVIDFLYKNNVKLFRSSTEGNILIKLMNISFTPNQILGRYIYSFSATAYEINEFNLEQCNNYNIQSLGKVDEQLAFTRTHIGQFNQKVKAGEDVLKLLNSYYQKYAKEGYICQINYLDHLKLEMETEPYLIGENDDGPYPLENQLSRSINKEAAAALGYIAYINDKPIVINKEGIYELKNEGLEITSLVFPVDTTIRLDYHVSVSQKEDTSQLAKSINFFKRVGQCWGKFDYKTSIYQKIWNKYYEKYSTYSQSMISLNGIKVEADPGTVVYIKENKENAFQRHVIGETCTLAFEDPESIIEGIYFSGLHLEEANENERQRDNIPSNKFIETGKTIDFLEDTEGLIKNGVYTFTEPYLKAYLQQQKDKYKVKVKNKKNDKGTTAIVAEDKVQKKNGDYILLLEPIISFLNEEEALLIDEDSIELSFNNFTGDYYIDSKQNEDKDNQVDVDKDQLNKTTIKFNTGDHILDAEAADSTTAAINKESIEDNGDNTSNLILKKDIEDVNTYELTINELYDKIFSLILEQEIDSTNKYIWYNNHWYPFTEDHDLICPVEGLIDYYCDVMKGILN